MKAIRMMYIVGIYILGAPVILAFLLALGVWAMFNYRATFGYWHGVMDVWQPLFEGIVCGVKFNWHWAKTGELDFDCLMD